MTGINTTQVRDDIKCDCVGATGPNPECGRCGGSGCISGPVATPWRYSINYGPEGEANWANVYAPDGSCVGNLPTRHAIAIVHAGNASPPLKVEDNPYIDGVDHDRDRLITELAERIKTHVHSDPWWVAEKAVSILTAKGWAPTK